LLGSPVLGQGIRNGSMPATVEQCRRRYDSGRRDEWPCSLFCSSDWGRACRGDTLGSLRQAPTSVSYRLGSCGPWPPGAGVFLLWPRNHSHAQWVAGRDPLCGGHDSLARPSEPPNRLMGTLLEQIATALLPNSVALGGISCNQAI
jgi:hypothetical protein